MPQIKNKEITNFYVAFHDKNGKQVYTRTLEAPFDMDDLMKEGILRFKIYPGEYTVSCFADFAPGSLTSGNISYSESSLSFSRVPGQNNVFQTQTSNTRAIFTQVTALPIGNPASQTPVEINIDEDKCFMSRVGTQFVDLPPIVTRIDIYYSGVATKLRFGGAFARFTGNDVVYKSIEAASYQTANSINYQSPVLPSSEVVLGYVNPSRGGVDDPKEVALEVEFYNGNQLIGATSYPGTVGTNPTPMDADGIPVNDLVLDPKKVLNFKFQGFTIVEIRLMGWGDITGGEITPL